jgi:hypothetical protein
MELAGHSGRLFFPAVAILRFLGELCGCGDGVSLRCLLLLLLAFGVVAFVATIAFVVFASLR